MEREVQRLASMVVWRGFGFCWLAIVTTMGGVLFDLSLACRIGALLAVALAVALQLRAETYHRIKRITETEVWTLLESHLRPPKEIARRTTISAMQVELREEALSAAMKGAGLLAISFVLRLLY